MAISNVRFYKLNVLPDFDGNKHKGIFVHVTGIMYKDKNGSLLMNTDKLTLLQWLSTRHITSIESGLWFGGENGWELLSNETNSAAINAAITDKIATLNAEGYAQATISGSTLTISGIKETNGKIEKDDTKKLDVAIDGTYNNLTNKIATQSTVTTAINGLNTTETIQAVTKTTSGNNTTLTFNGVKEENGLISQGTDNEELTVGNAKLKIQIGSNEAGAFEVFSANAQADSTIQLNENVFKKDGDVISVITPTAVASDNRLVTEKDIASLGGAMHYKGAITSANSLNPDNWPETVAAGDVYIATGKFEKDGNIIESGDLIVFNSATLTDYKVVQSNITLGTGVGQVAANTEGLTEGNLVVATGTGIKTTNISASVLEGTNSNRNLVYGNITGGVSIKDSLTVLGKDLGKTINITSNNKSIEIAANASENATGVVVDLVWNTIME